MMPVILGGVLMAAARKVKMDPGVRQDDDVRPPPRQQRVAGTLRRIALANAGIHFLTHLVE